MWLPRFLVNSMLAAAARKEAGHNHRQALHGYRRAARHAARHGRHLDVRVTAADGIYRVLQRLADRAPRGPADRDAHDTEAILAKARTREELFRAHVDAADALVARARRSLGRHAEAQLKHDLRAARDAQAAEVSYEYALLEGRRRDLAAAGRDLRAAIDRRAAGVSGRAAFTLAKMIDYGRGIPYEDRVPYRTATGPEVPPGGPASPGPGAVRHAYLSALGYGSGSEALAGAIDLCRTAIRLTGHDERGEGPSAFLAQLLDEYGDAAGAASARAHLEIPDKLGAAFDETYAPGHHERDSDLGHGERTRARSLAPFLTARLRPTETVADIQRSVLRAPEGPGGRVPSGYLVLTDERLLFLDDAPFRQWRFDSADPTSEYELLAIDRPSVIGVRQTRDEDGDSWLEIAVPPAGGGTAAPGGRVSVRVRTAPDLWLATLRPPRPGGVRRT